MKAIAKSFHRVAQGIGLLVLAPFASFAYAADVGAVDEGSPAVEEIVVTGSYIKGSAEDAALPIDVISQADLQEQGNPTLLEMVRNLGISSGTLGEENQFQAGRGQGAGSVTTINLRGLGSSRTLVLLNGHRHVTTQAQGVDISFMPQAALDRTEILKDGAAALYGSDAIAGVVNLITRGEFEGFEMTGSNQWIEDSDGQQNANMIFGMGNGKLHWMTAIEYEERNELKIRDRDWALRPRTQNAAGGWSAIANPATIFPANFVPIGGITGQADSQCDNLGGESYPTFTLNPANGTFPVTGTNCGFQYTFFDNIVNPSEAYRSWTEVNYDTSDHSKIHFEALYTRINFQTNSSPSYAPQSLFGADRFIAGTHPGLVQYKLDNPTSVIAQEPAGTGAFLLSRAFGSTGWYGNGVRPYGETNTYRLGLDFSGDSFDGAIGYDFSVNYSHRERVTETPDTVVENMAFALDGWGGPNCARPVGTNAAAPPAVPAVRPAGCLFFNPFSNAIQRSVINGHTNPQFNPALANDPDLKNWLIQWQHYNVVDELLVWDAVLNGELGFELPGGNIGWAFGVQARNEKYDVGLNSVANRAESPCPFNNTFSVSLGNITGPAFTSCQTALPGQQVSTGILGFLSAYDETTTKRTIYATFGELAVPIFDSVDMQLAVRFEDYGEDVGSTIDPKAAIRWQTTDWLTLRGSISTTFRGPAQSYLSGRATTLQFVAPTNAFKAVDVVGNADLEPETAVATNFGAIVNLGGFTGSVDYWEFNFKDPFQTESSAQLVNRYSQPTLTNPVGLFCQGPSAAFPAGGTGFGTPDCNELSTHIFPLATTAAGITRIDTYIINGSDIDTSGVDVSLQYTFDDIFGGELDIGTEGTYTLEYKSDDFVDLGGVVLGPGGDFAGFYNATSNPFSGLPELKGNIYTRYRNGGLTLTGVMRYLDEYTNQAPPNANSTPYSQFEQTWFREIDSMTTFDATAMYAWRDFIFTASVFNLTDEDPPWVGVDLNYDANNASALGRMFKFQMTYTLGGG